MVVISFQFCTKPLSCPKEIWRIVKAIKLIDLDKSIISCLDGWDTCHTTFLTSWLKSYEIVLALVLSLFIQSYHNFAQVATAQLLWYVENSDMFNFDFFFILSCVIILLMLQQLSCPGMCKIVTWSDHHFNALAINISLQDLDNELINPL